MTNTINAEIKALEGQLRLDAQRLAELKRSLPPMPVQDYQLNTRDGPVALSEFFFDKEDLIVIHNMGTQCSHCTMWADGFNGVVNHLMDRAGIVLVSPDTADVLEEFADDRGWLFPVASANGTTFNRDLGMEIDGAAQPGMSTFHRDPETGTIVRVTSEDFDAFDLFTSVWHLIARLKHGVNGWEPRTRYEHEDNVESDEEPGCGTGCGCH
jgi:predicted dithiol-disulfide oxidoreductase (DUF899 family)